VQFEFPWALGPPDGRYLVRAAAGEPPSHVLVLATLGAPERRRLPRGRGTRTVPREPAPAPVTTARATVIEAESTTEADAARWLAAAGPEDAERALAQIARAVRAHRIASADPSVREPAIAQALVVRAGHGAGEQVAEGRWSAACELEPARPPRRRRVAGLRPQERLAELLGGHDRPLACEELTLRARQDLDGGHLREAALQLRAALDAALVELAASDGGDMPRRLEELRERQPGVVSLAEQGLAGTLAPDARERLSESLSRLESALRARVAGIT